MFPATQLERKKHPFVRVEDKPPGKVVCGLCLCGDDGRDEEKCRAIRVSAPAW